MLFESAGDDYDYDNDYDYSHDDDYDNKQRESSDTMELSAKVCCPFCGAQSSLKPSETIYGELAAVVIPESDKHEKKETWWIGVCTGCEQPILVQDAGDRVFPSPIPAPSDRRIPADIRNEFHEAKNCLSVEAYRATAFMAHRAVRSACADHKVREQDLVGQLDLMVTKQYLPRKLVEQIREVLWIRQDPATSERPVFKKDAIDVLQAAEQLLYILYIAPAIGKELRMRKERPVE